MFLLWIHTSHWVSDDSSTLKVQGDYWNSLIFLTGIAGFLAVFIVPLFPLGFGVLLFSYALPLGLYINERNGRVSLYRFFLEGPPRFERSVRFSFGAMQNGFLGVDVGVPG